MFLFHRRFFRNTRAPSSFDTPSHIQHHHVDHLTVGSCTNLYLNFRCWTRVGSMVLVNQLNSEGENQQFRNHSKWLSGQGARSVANAGLSMGT